MLTWLWRCAHKLTFNIQHSLSYDYSEEIEVLKAEIADAKACTAEEIAQIAAYD